LQGGDGDAPVSRETGKKGCCLLEGLESSQEKDYTPEEDHLGEPSGSISVGWVERARRGGYLFQLKGEMRELWWMFASESQVLP